MPRSGNYLRTVAYAFSGKYAKTPVSRAHFGQDYASNFHSRQTCASKPLQLTPLLCQKGLEIEGFWANLCFQLLQNYALSHTLMECRSQARAACAGCRPQHGIFGWYLPDMPGDLHTGFVMAFGGCVAWPIVLLALVAEPEESRFAWKWCCGVELWIFALQRDLVFWKGKRRAVW